MNSDERKEYDPPVLARVGVASTVVLGGTGGPPDQPLEPPTMLNGNIELGLDD